MSKKDHGAGSHYHDITCVSTLCMKRFSHDKRWFELVPPPDVVAAFQNDTTQPVARQDFQVREKQSAAVVHKSRLDDDEDEAGNDGGTAYGGAVYGESAGANAQVAGVNAPSAGANAQPGAYAQTHAQTPGTRAAGTRAAGDPRMRELLDYYYDADGKVRCISLRDERLTEENITGNYYKIYHKDDVRTGFVTGICDKYGNKTSKAVCPECKVALPPMAGRNRLIFLPIVGVSRSGKSIALSHGLNGFLDECIPYTLEDGVASRDAATMQYLDSIAYNVEKNHMIDGTLVVERLMWTIDRRDGLPFDIMTFDVPGEHIANAQGNANEQFRKVNLKNLLENADALIVIICPEQVKKFTTWDIDSLSTSRGDTEESRDTIRSMEAMVALMKSEADPNETFKSRKTPVMMLLTKLDMLKETYPGDAVRKDVDTSLRMQMNKLLGLEQYNHDKSAFRVDSGALSNISGSTGELFDELFRSDYNRVKSLSDVEYLGCFAASFQGYDAAAGSGKIVIEDKIRPYDPFYWLFLKLGIFQPIKVETVQKSWFQKIRERLTE